MSDKYVLMYDHGNVWNILERFEPVGGMKPYYKKYLGSESKENLERTLVVLNNAEEAVKNV
jgi:hypothetical protein